MKHPSERSCQSNLPTRRRYETPLKPSRLQNIQQVRAASIQRKVDSVQQIKFSKSIVVDDSSMFDTCFNTHPQSTESTPIRQQLMSTAESAFDKVLKETGLKIVRSVFPTHSRTESSSYQFVQSVKDSHLPSGDYVILPRDTYEQLLRGDWVCQESGPREPPRALTPHEHHSAFFS